MTKTETLNDVMQFDHVIRVDRAGNVHDVDDVYAPEVYWYTTDDGNGELTPLEGGWSLMDGYSGQYRYSGPIMHASEYIGGGMARDILRTPGLYVALVIEDLDDPGASEAVGWAVAFQPTDETDTVGEYVALDAEDGDNLAIIETLGGSVWLRSEAIDDDDVDLTHALDAELVVSLDSHRGHYISADYCVAVAHLIGEAPGNDYAGRDRMAKLRALEAEAEAAADTYRDALNGERHDDMVDASEFIHDLTEEVESIIAEAGYVTEWNDSGVSVFRAINHDEENEHE